MRTCLRGASPNLALRVTGIMFWRKFGNGSGHAGNNPSTVQTEITLEALQRMLANMADAEIIERQTHPDQKVIFVYIKTLIDQKRLNESVIEPLNRCVQDTIYDCIATSKVEIVTTLEEAQNRLLSGSVLLHDPMRNRWMAVPLENPLGRSIQTSDTETVIYGPKYSFSEQLEQNITMSRRRLPSASLKTEKFTVGSLTKTTVVLMYIEGLTKPEFISAARTEISKIDFDQFYDTSQVAAFMEDHHHSIFPQFLQIGIPYMIGPLLP
jgi:hypothetical protein